MKFKKSNILLGIFMLAMLGLGFNYTNCGSEMSQNDFSTNSLNNNNQQQLIQKKEPVSANDDYGAPTIATAKELTGQKFRLPLTGALVLLETMELTPPKGLMCY